MFAASLVLYVGLVAGTASAGLAAQSLMAVKEVSVLGAQISPSLTRVSRDGGYSVLLDGQIVWLYDDTESLSDSGSLLSFVSNSAAYASQPHSSSLNVRDFSVVSVDAGPGGGKDSAVLGGEVAEAGGWIPFEAYERRFNTEKKDGDERIAVCTSTWSRRIERRRTTDDQKGPGHARLRST